MRSSNQIRVRSALRVAIIAIAFVTFSLSSIEARANCSSPNATIGSLDFQSGFKYCDGTNWLVVGSTSFPLLGPNGSAAAPTYGFSASSSTGMYSPGIGTLALTNAGTMSVLIDGGGDVGIGTTLASSRLVVSSTEPTGTFFKLAIAGTGSNQIAGLDMTTVDTGNDLGAGSDKGWSLSTYGTSYTTASLRNDFEIQYYNGTAWASDLFMDATTGFVGLGTRTPSQRLDATGSVQVSTSVISPQVMGAGATTLNIYPGTTSPTTNGSAITLTGGPSGTTSGVGGAVTISGGWGRNGFSGGALTLASGSATSGNSRGADAIVRAGPGTGTGDGGALSLFGGDASTSGVGGAVAIRGGKGQSGNPGGAINVSAGNSGGSSADGASVTISGGAASGTNMNGGDVILAGGTMTGTGTLGNIRITGNVGIGTTVAISALDVRGGAIAAGSQSNTLGGEVRFYDIGTNGVNFIALRAPPSITANKTWTLPSTDGTPGQILKTNGSAVLSWGVQQGGDFFKNGSLSMTGQLAANTGTTAAPKYTFTGDLDTGMYMIAPNTVSFAVAGVDVMTITPGRVGINSTNPQAAFDLSINGGEYWSGDLKGNSVEDNAIVSIQSLDQSGAPTFEWYAPGSGFPGWHMTIPANSGNDLYFDRTSNLTNPEPSIVIKRTGGFAVGTSLMPTGARLHVTKGAIAAGSQSSTVPGEVRMYEVDSVGPNFVAFRAPSQVTTDTTWVLPNSDGTVGQVLETDGAGSLSWSTNTGTMGKIDLIDQTSAIGYTTIYTAPADGYYALFSMLETTTAGTSGTFTLTLRYTDDNNNVITTAAVCTVNVNGIIFATNVTPIYVKSGTDIQYSTQANSIVGSPKYDLHIRLRNWD